MKNDLVRKIYFYNADDKDLEKFTARFLSGGLLWVYIALHPDKKWKLIFKKLNGKDKVLFIKEYNKAFLFTRMYTVLTKLSIGHEIKLCNLFLPPSAKGFPEAFIRADRADELRWKEILELMS